MDPLTHGVIGLGVAAAITGETNLLSPITIGAVVGAMSPDIDIILKYWGDYKYLKHHRGETHSLISVGILSIGIAFILKLIFPEYGYLSIFIPTLIGTASHVFFDALNSYGVRPLLPFKNKRYLKSLLMLYDPFITVLCFGLFFSNMAWGYKATISVAFLALYITHRDLAKKESARVIREEYNLTSKDELNIMPNPVNIFKWDFVISKEGEKIVGKINYLSNRVEEIKRLENEESELIEIAYSTELGKYFDDFTSSINHVRVFENKINTEVELQFIDLRYYLKEDFVHHATFVFDNDKNLKQSVFRPYKYEKQIIVGENKKTL